MKIYEYFIKQTDHQINEHQIQNFFIFYLFTS
jgi:hypothetical protein